MKRLKREDRDLSKSVAGQFLAEHCCRWKLSICDQTTANSSSCSIDLSNTLSLVTFCSLQAAASDPLDSQLNAADTCTAIQFDFDSLTSRFLKFVHDFS